MRAEDPVLYTVGYEGFVPSALVRALQDRRIERVVDVRLTPHSRKKGFSLMSLFERLHKAGIHYDHISELGNPPEIRAAFHAGELAEGRRRYRGLITNGAAPYVDALIGLARAQRTAIMCRESDPEACHRWVIAEVAVERAGGGLRVEHL